MPSYTYRTGILFTLSDSVDADQHEIKLFLRYTVIPGAEATRFEPGYGPIVNIVEARISSSDIALSVGELAPDWLWPFLEEDAELEREMLAHAAHEDEAARDHIADMRREEIQLGRETA